MDKICSEMKIEVKAKASKSNKTTKKPTKKAVASRRAVSNRRTPKR